jgi:hypothetical protein
MVFRRTLTRSQPAGPVQAYITFRAAAPLATHWRPASCAEVDCAHYVNGWATTVLPGSDEEALVRQAGRVWRHQVQGGPWPDAAGFLRFEFEAGQVCFAAHRHRVPLERPPLFVVRNGDWRANLGVRRTHTRATDWVDEFANHQDKVARRAGRG